MKQKDKFEEWQEESLNILYDELKDIKKKKEDIEYLIDIIKNYNLKDDR